MTTVRITIRIPKELWDFGKKQARGLAKQELRKKASFSRFVALVIKERRDKVERRENNGR